MRGSTAGCLPQQPVFGRARALVRWETCGVATRGDLAGLTWLEVTECYYFCQWRSDPFQNHKIPRLCLISFQLCSFGEQQIDPPDCKQQKLITAAPLYVELGQCCFPALDLAPSLAALGQEPTVESERGAAPSNAAGSCSSPKQASPPCVGCQGVL